MKIIVCGSRDWTDSNPIRMFLKSFAEKPKEVTIIHGAARGADRIAGRLATTYGFKVQSFPADWLGHGKAAGPIRNKIMLDSTTPSLVVAFKDGFDHTLERGGTENMVRIAKEAGVPTWVISHG